MLPQGTLFRPSRRERLEQGKDTSSYGEQFGCVEANVLLSI